MLGTCFPNLTSALLYITKEEGVALLLLQTTAAGLPDNIYAGPGVVSNHHAGFNYTLVLFSRLCPPFFLGCFTHGAHLPYLPYFEEG